MLILILILIFVICFSVFSFTYVTPQEQVVSSLGSYEIVDYCSYGYIGDITEYGKYIYDKPNFEDNEYIKQMTEETVNELNSYIDNYEEWVGVITEEIEGDMDKEFAETYDFERNIISNTDYCYIDSEDESNRFTSYNLYFYDTETKTLYYFHNNI